MIISWLGVIVGIGGILMGEYLEGGHFESLIQGTAAMIVFGGTLGATLLSSTQQEFIAAVKALPKVFFKNGTPLDPLVKELIQLATTARKEGILGLEKFVPQIKNQFFASHLRHIVDGYDPNVLKEMMEERIYKEEEEKTAIAKVFETAGGYSPTIGIIGAVLGLIKVMENLTDTSKLGAGIAVAFVATIYGVGSANLILIPLGNKLKKIAKHEVLELEIIMTGLLGIQSGLNPRVIEDRLHEILAAHHGGKSHSSEGAGAAQMKRAA